MHTHTHPHYNMQPTGYWQQVLPTIDATFHAVFLDDFPLPLDDNRGDDDDDDTAAKRRLQAQRDERRILAAAGSRWHAFLDLVVR